MTLILTDLTSILTDLTVLKGRVLASTLGSTLPSRRLQIPAPELTLSHGRLLAPALQLTDFGWAWRPKLNQHYRTARGLAPEVESTLLRNFGSLVLGPSLASFGYLWALFLGAFGRALVWHVRCRNMLHLGGSVHLTGLTKIKVVDGRIVVTMLRGGGSIDCAFQIQLFFC